MSAPNQNKRSSASTTLSEALVSEEGDIDGYRPFLGRLKQSFEQGEGHDLTITCNGRQWKVFKLVLCLHSEVFEKMLRGNFKVSSQEISAAHIH